VSCCVVSRRALSVVAATALLALFGCGDDGSSGDSEKAPERAVIALDFFANAVHAPIYAAVREGLDTERGVDLQIRTPGSGPDGLKLLAAGRVDVAVLDIHDLGIAREKGTDVVGIGALVQRPLAAIIAQREIARPKDLEGEKVGVSGLPSDPAVLDAVMRDDGGDIREVEQVTIGFNAVPNLAEGKVAAVPAFWNAEGVALRERGVAVNEFRVDEFGAPPYPEVVLITTRHHLESEREKVRSVVRAIGDGVEAVREDPDAAVADIAKAGGAKPALVRAQLDAVMPAFDPPITLDRDVLEQWAAWDARFGILERRPDVAKTFAFDVAD
jgi:NitT/TauT family transport system substrate-binding protein/putative hydroxymethylpyrimidine transport system substrate-binding protein